MKFGLNILLFAYIASNLTLSDKCVYLVDK